MKKSDRPAEAIECKLSGVVSAPPQQPNSDALQRWIINSFRETRFQNVLTRARLLPKISWFWHRQGNTQHSDVASAIIAGSTNDYKQILIKQNQLAHTVFELDPQTELLLLISPEVDFVFGTVLSTLENFSTHIIFREKELREHTNNLSPFYSKQVTPLPKRTRVHIAAGSNKNR